MVGLVHQIDFWTLIRRWSNSQYKMTIARLTNPLIDERINSIAVDVESNIHIHIIMIGNVAAATIFVVVRVRVKFIRSEIVADFPDIEHRVVYTLLAGIVPKDMLTLPFANPCANKLNSSICRPFP